MSQHLLIPAGFCTIGLKQYTGKCLEQDTVKPPWASQCCSSESSWCHREGPRRTGAIARGLGTGSGVCCVVLAMQKSRCDLVTELPPGTPQDPCPPSPLLVVGRQLGGLSPSPGTVLSTSCSARAAPLVLLWYGSVVTAIKILCWRWR